MLDAAVHGEGVLNLFCVIKDAGVCANKPEHMYELGVDRGDDIVLHRQEKDCDLVEGED